MKTAKEYFEENLGKKFLKQIIAMKDEAMILLLIQSYGFYCASEAIDEINLKFLL